MSSVSSLWRSAALGLALASVAATAAAGAQGVIPPGSALTDADKLGEQMRAVAVNPRDVPALIRAGELSLKLDDLSGAASLFARAEQIDPRNARLKAGEASVLVRSERPGQALRYFALAQSDGLDPSAFAADRGLAFDLIGQQERAQRDYRLALTTGANPEVLRRYALSLGISGKRDEALAVLDPLLRDTDRGAWRARAFVLAMAGDVAGAERIATTMMPPGMADGLRPFFQRLPSLPAVDRAFAVHFGETQPTAARAIDARLVPPLAPLGPDAGVPVIVARANPVPPQRPHDDRRGRRAAKDKDKADRVELAMIRNPTPALPPPPAYRGQPIPTVAPAEPRSAPMNATARANAQALASLTSAPSPPSPTRAPTPSWEARNRRMTLAAAVPMRIPAASPTPTRTPAPTPTPTPTPTLAQTRTPAPAPPSTAASTLRPFPGARPTSVAPPAALVAEAGRPDATPIPTPAVKSARDTATSTPLVTSAPPPAMRVAGPPAPVSNAVASPAAGAASIPPAIELASAAVSASPEAARPPDFSTPAGSPPLTVSSAVAPPGSSIEQPAADRPVPRALASRQADSILARIVAGLSIPAAELGVRDMPGARATADPPLVEEAKAKEARDAAASRLLADKAAAEKASADKRAVERKAIADKKARAEKKIAEAKKLADAKVAAEARKAERANPARIWVQVAGGASAADLPSAWAAAKAKAPRVFAGKQGWWTPLRATNRVLAGPFSTDDDARDFVNALAKEGVPAFRFTSENGQSITRLPTK